MLTCRNIYINGDLILNYLHFVSLAKTVCTNTTFNCSQQCGVRVDGSEYCFCNTGYKLNADGYTCDGKYRAHANPSFINQYC